MNAATSYVMNESLPRLRPRLAIGLGALLPMLAGCAWHAPAAGDREVVEAAPHSVISDWPARCSDRLGDIMHIGPEMLSVRVKHDTVVDGRIIKSPKRLPGTDERFGGIYGRGIIRHYRGADPGEGNLLSEGLCFFSGVEVAPSQGTKKNLVSSPDESPSHGEKWAVNLRGTWLRLDEATNGPTRGLIVHMTSYGGYEYEKPVIQEMRDRGWAVLWVDSSMVKPETVRFDVDPDDMEPAAKRIAATIDDRVAEAAYAVEAGLDYVKREHPEIPQSPLIAMGYSAGALATPTVVALMPSRFDAAVLVGAGANLFDIAQNSALTDGGIKLKWKRSPSRAERRRLTEMYLEDSRLDPYWCAEYLQDKPVLMLHALLDEIVPADDGELLYSRLGRPERVKFLLGHELLFFHLPSQATMMADWVDQAVLNSPRASTRVSSSTAHTP